MSAPPTLHQSICHLTPTTTTLGLMPPLYFRLYYACIVYLPTPLNIHQNILGLPLVLGEAYIEVAKYIYSWVEWRVLTGFVIYEQLVIVTLFPHLVYEHIA